ncbi:MAG: hypothetical protein CM15mP93_16800 [Thiotrichaceae bacterium]|nr:MAG: hypothetical protein CM15mP93_16800 [Thiotrichaceae bacterium]
MLFQKMIVLLLALETGCFQTYKISWKIFPVTDALTMFRGYKVSIVKDPLFKKYLSTGHIFEPLISAYGNLREL